MKRKLTLLAAIACLCGRGGGGVANAQLFIHIYPSQDNPTTQTLWVFSGSSQTTTSWSIRTSGGYSARDSWEVGGNLFNANKPNEQTFTLSPLLSSSNTNDIDSVRARIPGGGRTNITFAASATNTPTMTFGGSSGGSRTIASLWLDEDPGDEDDMGIRVSGSNFSYSSSVSSSWTGSGILNKPIGDFFTGTFNNNQPLAPRFASTSGQVRIVVNNQIIPEPEEYALIFGLFALGFVFFHRWQKKKRQAAATS